MRQAGRYLPEYRAARSKAGSFLELCYNPELAAEVTLQPLERFDLDAGIVFADILVVPHAAGLQLTFKEGEGPVVETVRDAKSLQRLQPIGGTWQVKSICETLRRVSTRLPSQCSLIGFCGAPWTVASYIIEGGSSNRALAIRIASEGPAWFGSLIGFLVEQSVDYLSAQIQAGAEAVQIFDSWAGDLPPALRQLWVDKPIADIVEKLRSKHASVPVIVFAKGAGAGHREIVLSSGCDGVGIESDLAMSWASQNLSDLCAVQGNLDPEALLGPESEMLEQTCAILKSISYDRHIFNLGHGIRPETDPHRLDLVVKTVREYDRARGHG